MRGSVRRGRVYRRCGCRDEARRQLGACCPLLVSDAGHGTWTFAVDLPGAERRRTVRRGGFANREDAAVALRRFLDGRSVGVDADPDQTVGEYLLAWLAGKRLVVKPTSFVRYRDYVYQDLVPALGRVWLGELSYAHIAVFTRDQLAAGRGRTTIYRCLATLSSALGEAVRRHRLAYNPARPVPIPRPPAAERSVWTGAQAARFLEYCHGADPLFADLVEVLVGTGLRRGEALGLHWAHVELDRRVLFVRWTLSAIDNHDLVLTVPKTKGSRAWVALSDRVAAALEHRARNRGPLAADDLEAGTCSTVRTVGRCTRSMS